MREVEAPSPFSYPFSAAASEPVGGSAPPREGEVEHRPRILVVDDDQSMCEFVELTLRRQMFDVVWRTSAQDALELVGDNDFDVILTDLSMAGMGGLELCERIVGMRPDVPVIVVTAYGSMESAVAAIRVGAYDFITKPVDAKVLGITVGRALQHHRLRDEVKRLRLEVGGTHRFERILGTSPAMKKVFDLVVRVADSDASVLVTGESGTGKELIAKAIHEQSSSKSGPFLAINCAAVPPTLLESELFGHVRGAFTDAKSSRSGLFVEADGGTLFLDEIGELPIEVQPKLLRALQERKVRPVGGSSEVPFNARIVAATNRDLETEVYEKRFREDLYYRINVVRVEVPPLRERGGDILLLAQSFVDRFAARGNKEVKGIATPAAERLLAYDWPGNVRELENCMERAVALTRFEQIVVEDLPEKIRDYKADRLVFAADDPSELVSLDELERRYVLRVLALVAGNKSRAAEILGFDRRTLYRKLDRYGKGT
jgi:two-component system response regulator HydG